MKLESPIDNILHSHEYADTSLVRVVVDIESTINGPEGNRPDPLHPENRPVYIGCYVPQTGAYSCFEQDKITECIDYLNSVPGEGLYLIGHNIKFDLHLLIRNGLHINKIKYVHDTQVACYLLSGQQYIMPSLEKAAEVESVAFTKDTRLKEYWNAGTPTEDIPPEIIFPYLKADVKTTNDVYEYQVKQLDDDPKLRVLFNVHMFTLLMLVEIERNGITFDIRRAIEWTDNIQDQIEELESRQCQFLDEAMPDWQDKCPDTKIFSGRTISTLLTGEPGLPYNEREPSGDFYKNGKEKLQTVTKKLVPNSHFDLIDLLDIKDIISYNDSLGFSTDAESLNYMKSHAGDIILIDIIECVQEWRKISKLKGTYLDNFLKQAEEYGEAVVHPNYHQTTTATGRLSCSKPNGQNMPPVIEELFTGRIQSYDFKQLELCVAAHLSQDTLMIKDINNDIDIHNEVGRESGLCVPMTHAVRRAVKGTVFGTIYGGGPKTIAKQSGFDIDIIKATQEGFKSRYHEYTKYVRASFSDLSKCVWTDPEGRLGPDGGLMQVSGYTLPTGRYYNFNKDQFSHFTRKATYSWTKASNYKVQGLATGDLVPGLLALLYVYKRWYDEDGLLKWVRFFSTIHDSIKLRVSELSPDEDVQKINAVMVGMAEHALPELYLRWTGEELATKLVLEIGEKDDS